GGAEHPSTDPQEMPVPFDRWTERIVAAQDERSRRELLAEIGRWRATHLTDIPALREAAFAMSRLYALVGDNESAQSEGQSLVSLGQTPPIGTVDELAATKAYLSSLGAKALITGEAARKADAPRGRGDRGPRNERPERTERQRAPETRAADAEGSVVA